MRKLLLTLLSSAAVLFAQAGVEYPIDFQKQFSFGGNQFEGWTIYAPEGTLTKSISNFFPDYSSDNAVQILLDQEYGAWSPSEYTDESQLSDTWLITPEFTVNYDLDVLAFTVSVYGMSSNVNNRFKVYVSEGGTAKEDFTEIESGGVRGSMGGATYTNSSSFRYKLSDYKGKKIRLAFVNEGNKVGMMGFSNISLGSWYGVLDHDSNYYDNIILESSNTLQYSLKISTPETAQGFYLSFTTSGGFSYDFYDESRSIRLNSVSTVYLNVPDIIMNSASETYTMTVTPNYEGAGSLVITGNLLEVEKEFDYVGVLEEATGTWCGYCPWGAASLSYYADYYNGENGTPKVIPIAIHGDDPMEIEASISDYFGEWMTNEGNGGYPAISVNRGGTLTPSPDPRVVGTRLQQYFAEKSYAKVDLNKVYFAEEGKDMVAAYTVKSSFDAPEGLFAASVIITEDNVQGYTYRYDQTSFLAQTGVTKQQVLSTLGESWLPYLEPYFGVSTVSYKNIQYSHVARAAFPSYAGVAVPGIDKGSEYQGRISFSMPSNVRVKENTTVVILIQNVSTGEIVAADDISYDDFTMESGVESHYVGAEISAIVQNNNLIVNVDEDAVIEVYGIDGIKYMEANVTCGENILPLDAAGRMLIVNVKGSKASKQFKLVNK